ncbi:MAG: AAA family ATPase, partial [bacterium]|nr:AAA family ATPase [bacterium]
MDFYDVLDQIIALLRQRGRVSYQALKRQFDLDDAYIEDLKVELIEVQELASDRDGKMLVWAGEAATPEPASPPPESATQEAQSSPPEPYTPDAERRQLTVMFCDLADSTKLSGQLDLEDLLDVIRAYQSTSADVIERYEGHIAQYLGDGLLVYFGWPLAHEDDAQRSVHAGLGIIEAMGDLNTRLEKDKGIRLAVRIGIHTGPVVIGEMGGGGRHERLALGETTNIASRLEGMAQPNTVVVSETTYRLIEGYFSCDDLGTHTLKGVATPMQTYQVRETTGVQERLDAAMTRGLTSLVGRESEVSLLLERWQQVQDGQGQVVLLSGEAGIGKSRLVQLLKGHVASEPHTQLECHSSPYYQNTALYPLIDLLQRILQWKSDGTSEAKLAKLEHTLRPYSLPLEETVPLFAALLSLPLPEARYPALQLGPQRQRQKTLEAIVAMVFELAEQQPVLFILEDLHWTDPSTLELLGILIEQAPTAALLILLTCRPEFEPPWGLRSHLTPIALSRFTRDQIETMVERVTGGKTVPAEVMQHLVEKTDGVPLYVEEMTKAILESGVLEDTAGHYALTRPLASLAIPTTLQDSLMARLDRLEMAKGIAQLGATIGRHFSYALLQAVSSLDKATLQGALERLVGVELVYQRGLLPQATYTFKHALVQDTAYQSLLKSARQQYHERIAQVMEERFPEAAEAQPELLAHHYTEAGLHAQAVISWQQAGQQAIQRSATQEAIAHLTKGLAVLTALPESPERTQRELALQTALGPVLSTTRGWSAPEVEHAYLRAHELCRKLGDPTQLFRVQRGLFYLYYTRGEFQRAQELGEQLLTLAQRQQDPTLLVVAQQSLGSVLLLRGEIGPGRAHLEQGMAHYNLQAHHGLGFLYGVDPGIACVAYSTWALWLLGYPEQTLQRSDEALILAQEASHPYTRAFALIWSAIAHGLCQEWQASYERTEAALTLTNEHGFAILQALGSVLRAWALAKQGQPPEDLTPLHQALAVMGAAEFEFLRPSELYALTEVYDHAG